MGTIDWLGRFEQVSKSLRLGMEAQGCEQLIVCIDDLMLLLAECSAPEVGLFQGSLGQILAAQERKDYLLVADLFEYEIAPLTRDLAIEKSIQSGIS